MASCPSLDGHHRDLPKAVFDSQSVLAYSVFYTVAASLACMESRVVTATRTGAGELPGCSRAPITSDDGQHSGVGRKEIAMQPLMEKDDLELSSTNDFV